MSEKVIGIKLADGSFYPIMKEGIPTNTTLELTTVSDDQTTIQLNLYRSETGTMEGAEYVDSLMIENLVPHPKLEPSFNLNLNLDENNVLSATIDDPETGITSNSTVSLVTLSEENQNIDNDFSISTPNEYSSIFNGVPTIVEDEENVFSENIENDADMIPEEEIDLPITPIEDTASTSQTTNDLVNFEDNFNDILTSNNESSFFDDDSIDEPPESEEDLSFDNTSSDEITSNNDSSFFDDDDSIDEPPESEEDDFSFDSLPDFDEIPENTDITNFNTADEESIDNSDFDFTSDSLPDFSDVTSDTSFLDTEDDSPFSFESLPEFDEIPENENITDFNATDFSLPDFDDIPELENNFSFDETDFELPDLDSSSSATDFEMSEPNSDFDDLDDLYEDSIRENERSQKRFVVPVTICVICALICLGVLSYILFIAPKHNKQSLEDSQIIEQILPNKTNQEATTKADENAAKVNQVVVTKDVVVPAPVLPKEEKSAEITHKVRWGDTLWDLSNTYYKTPWLFNKIAKENNIKNPDLILSGTTLIIPPR